MHCLHMCKFLFRPSFHFPPAFSFSLDCTREGLDLGKIPTFSRFFCLAASLTPLERHSRLPVPPAAAPGNVSRQSASAPPRHRHGRVPALAHGRGGAVLHRWLRLLHLAGQRLPRGDSQPMPQRLRLHRLRHFESKILLWKRLSWLLLYVIYM